MNLPIIKLEIEGIRNTLMVALKEQQLEMDEYIKKSVDDFCDPEKIKIFVQNAANKALADAIREEVKLFFWQGDGRKAVAEAVKTSILNNETYTPLDTV